MKDTLSNGMFLTSPVTQVLQRFNIIYPSLRISFFRKLRCSKYAASLHAEFSQLNNKSGKCVRRQAVSLYTQQVNPCQLHIPKKKHTKGICQNLHVPLNLKFQKTKLITTAIVTDVIKYDQCYVVGVKSDSSICGPFPNF